MCFILGKTEKQTNIAQYLITFIGIYADGPFIKSDFGHYSDSTDSYCTFLDLISSYVHSTILVYKKQSWHIDMYGQLLSICKVF